MMASQTIKVDIEIGPAMRAALDVLDLAAQMDDELQWSPHREELKHRAETLGELCEQLLNDGKGIV